MVLDVTMFSRDVESEISAEECAAMERHIVSCPRCNAACGSFKQTLALCRAEPRGEVPREIQDRVRGAVRELAAVGI
jgi:RNA polymerase sigma-70 factor (ECF subfamily)